MTAIGWPLIHNVIRRNKKSNTFGLFKERKSGRHWGWDFYAAFGTPCYAIADGEIAKIYGDKTDTEHFGLVVVLEFELSQKKLYAAYCHLAGAAVKERSSIKKGDLIGYTGNSGNAFNLSKQDEHLHFEIRTTPKPSAGGPPKRLDPIQVFQICPLNTPVIEP